MTTEGLSLKGYGVVQEINPVTKEVVSEEYFENVICKSGAQMLARVLATGTGASTYNWMVISTSASADARATTAIPATRTVSLAEVIPTITANGTTDIVTWVNTFPVGGSASINKFGMESAASGGTCFNEKTFSGVKDNSTNELKVTYNLSVAP